MRTVRAFGFLSVLASVAMVGGGCQTSTKYVVPVDGPAATAGLPLALDIENRSGPVIVQLDTSLSAPVVTARPLKTGAQSWSAASYSEEAGRGVLRVLHSPNDAEPSMAGPTLLLVRTPMAEGVRIRAAGGAIELRGVAPASVEIESGAFGGAGGSVTFQTLGDVTGAVTISTTAGDVLYQVGSGSMGKLDVSAGGNGLASIVSRDAGFTGASAGATKFTGVLNKGENVVKLSTMSGNARVEIQPRAKVAGQKSSGQ